MATPDILIIGAGVIGCSLARELAKANQKVVILDSGQAGNGASSAAAGLLAPTFGSPSLDPLVELCFESALMFESWVNELRSEGAGDVAFRRPGLFDLWLNAEQAAQGRGSSEIHARPGRRVELISGAELRRREPAVAAPLQGAAFYPDDAQVDPALLSRQVARVAESAGVIICEGQAARLVREGERITAVQTASTRYHPGLVVVAAGAFSGSLLAPLGLSLPTLPVKGQMMSACCRSSPVHAPISAGEALFVPRPDGSLALGVTVEDAGFDERVTLDGIRRIIANTVALVPSVGQLSFSHAWAGLRPATPDGWPYMGPLPPLGNLWVSTGHFRKGILLAPLSARLMAQSILSGRLAEPLQPFKPARLAKVTG